MAIVCTPLYAGVTEFISSCTEMCDLKRFCARNSGAQVRSTKRGSTGTKTATRHTGLLAKARPRSGTRISTAASMLLRSRAAPRQAHARVACPATAAAHTCGGLGWPYCDERARACLRLLTVNASRFPQQIEACLTESDSDVRAFIPPLLRSSGPRWRECYGGHSLCPAPPQIDKSVKRSPNFVVTVGGAGGSSGH